MENSLLSTFRKSVISLSPEALCDCATSCDNSVYIQLSYGMLIKIQLDATVCRYLFTAKSLYMFQVSQHPSSGVLKTVTAASGTGHNIGTATSLQCGLIGTQREVAVLIL